MDDKIDSNINKWKNENLLFAIFSQIAQKRAKI